MEIELAKLKPEEKKNIPKIWDTKYLAESGIDPNKPFSFFIAKSAQPIVGFIMELNNPDKVKSIIKRWKPSLLQKHHGVEVFHAKTVRIFVKGKLVVVLAGRKGNKSLDQVLNAQLSLKKGGSLADSPEYPKTMGKLQFGQHYTFYGNMRALLQMPSEVRGVPAPLLTSMVSTLSQIDGLALGVTMDKKRMLLKGIASLKKQIGFWRFSRTSKTVPACRLSRATPSWRSALALISMQSSENSKGLWEQCLPPKEPASP